MSTKRAREIVKEVLLECSSEDVSKVIRLAIVANAVKVKIGGKVADYERKDKDNI